LTTLDAAGFSARFFSAAKRLRASAVPAFEAADLRLRRFGALRRRFSAPLNEVLELAAERD
jgi:hypothetical protein